MKKPHVLVLLPLLAALSLLACGGNQSTNNQADSLPGSTADSTIGTTGEATTEESTSTDLTTAPGEMPTIDITDLNFTCSNVAFVKDEQLYFYQQDEEGRDIKYRLAAEKDQVLSCAYSPTSPDMYYITAREGELYLKTITWYDGSSLDPYEITPLGLTKEQCLDEDFPLELFVTKENEVIIPYSSTSVDDPGTLRAKLYKPGNELKEISVEEYYKLQDAYVERRCTWRNVNPKETPEGQDISVSRDSYPQLMYKGKSLTCDLDLKGLEYVCVRQTMEKSKLLFGVISELAGDVAHGPWCIANADGTNQRILLEDGISEVLKPRWIWTAKGHIAVFGKPAPSGKGYCLCLTKPEDNSIVRLEKGVSYWAVEEELEEE
ncbi:MAG: hypothetical protein CSA97_04020 [Bacteroidetes bacterium]|nr:MAG: hypothetical protein CSA97_04020 [Bacteroidota bacterium]